MTVEELVGTPTLRRARRSGGRGAHHRGHARRCTTGASPCSAASSASGARTAGGCGWTSPPRSSGTRTARPLYRLSQVVDIDARKRAAEQLQHLADHDALSGVFNRRRFEQELERELATPPRRGGRGAVLLLDVDRFKGINDTLGHASGRRRDLRLGRDLRQPAADHGRGGAAGRRRVRGAPPARGRRTTRSRSRAACASSRRSGSPSSPWTASGTVTLSVGVATFGDGEEIPTPDELLSQADHAMYDAKRAGGNRVSAAVARLTRQPRPDLGFGRACTRARCCCSWRLPAGVAAAGGDRSAAAAAGRPPVVLLVFDEFPVDDLLDPDGRIDAARFPNFANARAPRPPGSASGTTSSTRPRRPCRRSSTPALPRKGTGPGFGGPSVERLHAVRLARLRRRGRGVGVPALPARASARAPPRHGRGRDRPAARRASATRACARWIASMRGGAAPTLYMHHALLPARALDLPALGTPDPAAAARTPWAPSTGRSGSTTRSSPTTTTCATSSRWARWTATSAPDAPAAPRPGCSTAR